MIQDKTIEATFSNGEVWAIPIKQIALSRAEHYESEFASLKESIETDTLPLFEQNEYEVIDWAKNNMDWSDFDAKYLRTNMIEDTYEEQWPNVELVVK